MCEKGEQNERDWSEVSHRKKKKPTKMDVLTIMRVGWCVRRRCCTRGNRRAPDSEVNS